MVNHNYGMESPNYEKNFKIMRLKVWFMRFKVAIVR